MFFPLSLSLTLLTCFLFHRCTLSPITSQQYLVSRFPHSHRKILTLPSRYVSSIVLFTHSLVLLFHSLVYLFYAIVLFCFVIVLVFLDIRLRRVFCSCPVPFAFGINLFLTFFLSLHLGPPFSQHHEF